MNLPGNKKLTLPDGEEITLSQEAYDRYVEWRRAILMKAGQEIASKMPKFYGNVQLNLQGGKCVNVNMGETIR